MSKTFDITYTLNFSGKKTPNSKKNSQSIEEIVDAIVMELLFSLSLYPDLKIEIQRDEVNALKPLKSKIKHTSKKK